MPRRRASRCSLARQVAGKVQFSIALPAWRDLTPEGSPSARGLFFDSEAHIDLPVAARRIGYVFQNLALFPHLTVEENIQYGIKSCPHTSGDSGRWPCLILFASHTYTASSRIKSRVANASASLGPISGDRSGTAAARRTA